MASENTKNNQRPPIVVVMGHVDHGKTSLLDYIRKMTYDGKAASEGGEPRSVAEREAGGITQAVGAYEITHNGRRMTFIDTPGHEAFSKMRSRGAQVADSAILVVAADDGVKPQTKEAAKILEESKTPFVVAFTKIDKPGADINKAKNELTTAGVLLEGYGGQISFHGVSSKTGEGVNDLLDLILLAADLENLAFDPLAVASGFILEAKRDPRRGIEATVIVKNGTLIQGSEIHTPSARGKVKILEDFLGNSVGSITPSAPALVIGFENLPQIGESFSAESMGEISSVRKLPAMKIPNAKKDKATLNLILKAADGGSIEVLSSIIGAMGTEDKPLHIIEESVGDIADGDVKTAIATGAVIIGFKNKVDKGAKNLAEPHDVKIITSDVVYDLVKSVQEFLTELGTPKSFGELEVLAVFSQKRLDKQLVGGKILSGIVRNKAVFDVFREPSAEPITSGRVLSLKEKKTEITQAEAGKEIGLIVSAQKEIQVGDKIVIKK